MELVCIRRNPRLSEPGAPSQSVCAILSELSWWAAGGGGGLLRAWVWQRVSGVVGAGHCGGLCQTSNQQSFETRRRSVGPRNCDADTPIDAAIARHTRGHGEQADPLPHADGRPVGDPGSAAACAPDPHILGRGEATERHPHGGELSCTLSSSAWSAARGQLALEARSPALSSHGPLTSTPLGRPQHRNTADNNPEIPFKFTAQNEAIIAEVLKRYPPQYKKAAVMPILDLGQRQHGFTSISVMNEVARLLEMPPMRVYEVASFYTMYNRTPVGKFHVQACTTVPVLGILGGSVV